MTENGAAPSHHHDQKNILSSIDEPHLPTTSRKATKSSNQISSDPSAITTIMKTLEEQVRDGVEQARRSKEEAYREQKLAQERLRLVREEYDAAVATDKAAYANLQTIQEKSGGEETSKALAALEMEVDQLEKDVRRNHDA
jgi:hypothetical protein